MAAPRQPRPDRPPKPRRPGDRRPDRAEQARRSRLTTALIGVLALACLAGGFALLTSEQDAAKRNKDSARENTDSAPQSDVSSEQQSAEEEDIEGTDARDDERQDAARLASLRGLVVGIDPGHNGQNISREGRIARTVTVESTTSACDSIGQELALDNGSIASESALVMSVSQLVRSKLQQAGAEVRMTRLNNSGWGPCIDKRYDVLRDTDVVISIHTNDAPKKQRGYVVRVADAQAARVTPTKARFDRRLAVSVARAWRDETGLRAASTAGNDGIVEDASIALLGILAAPAIELSLGNLANDNDRAVLTDPADAERLANAIVNGLATYARDPEAAKTAGAAANKTTAAGAK